MTTSRKHVKHRKTVKAPALRRAVDSRGVPLRVGQRVRFDGTTYTVMAVRPVELPEGGQQEIVHFRSQDGNRVLQIHLPLVTIVDDGASTSKPRRSVRARLRH